MLKYRLYFDKDKETEWLNDMAAQGWAMKSFFAGLYTFEECKPGEYTYQVDFGDKMGYVTDDYKEFMNSADIEIVQVWGMWVILRKKASDGEFTLYSDVDSLIEHYKKILLMFKIVTIIELIGFFVEVFSAVQSGSLILWGFAGIIFSLALVIAKAAIHTKGVIKELKERQTGIEEPKSRNVSAFLASGMLLNSCALIMADSVAYPIKLTVQIVAIVMMLVGITETCRKKK